MSEQTINTVDAEVTETEQTAEVEQELTTEQQLAQAQQELAELKAELAELAARKSSSKGKREYVYTPFQATKDLNELRTAAGLKPVNSPMLYIYARKNAFVISVGADGRKEVDRESFLKWAIEHTEKQTKK